MPECQWEWSIYLEYARPFFRSRSFQLFEFDRSEGRPRSRLRPGWRWSRLIAEGLRMVGEGFLNSFCGRIRQDRIEPARRPPTENYDQRRQAQKSRTAATVAGLLQTMS